MTRRDLRGLEGLDALLGHPFSAPAEAVDPATLRSRLRDELGVPPAPAAIRVVEDGSWTRDGVDGVALRWSAGFGADVEGWLLRPAGERRALPGILALHCHGGMKFHGKEKIADGPVSPRFAANDGRVAAFRGDAYDGVAVANVFARAGYAVLAHDAFGWGGRRQRIADMPERVRRAAERDPASGSSDESERYDAHAGAAEDAVAKTLGVLGTSWGGIIAQGDLVAARILAERAAPGGVVAVGHSGGGARAGLLSALADDAVRGAGVVSMMSTIDAVLDGYVHTHTWALMTPGLGRVGEWPDIVAARAPRPLFVGYATGDRLFPLEGMRAADARIRARYRVAGAPDAYRAHWADAPHSFRAPAQHAFLDWASELFAS
ncbi:alpha/beta hydrolase family protein [Microbacterium gilvum]|uniref:Acetyl xylan esterase domain-containing protein n=1 Tax=Microbacterium gilvum TaxID=1336204 RepID=A0ABP9A830_9MICO